MTWDLVRDILFWMVVNVMVGVGMVSLAAYPPFWRAAGSLRGRYWRDVTSACLMAVFCMLIVWAPGPGMKIDIRAVPLGLAGWTYGWPAAALVGTVIIAARTLMGGPGVITTIYYTILCVAMIPFFHGRRKTLHTLAIMGLAQSFAGYAVGQLYYDKQPPGLEAGSPVWLFLTAVQISSLWIINWQVDSLNEKERLQKGLTGALHSKEAMLNVIPHAIFILDRSGRVTDRNEAARLLAGGSAIPAELLAYPEIEEALRLHKRISPVRISVSDARGGERIMLASTVPLEEDSLLLGVENVTTVVRQEREEARRDRLELLGRMAAMAAHEIKNPLTTIKGFLQILAGREEFARHRTTFALVQGEVEHINRVVGDFLDLSRTADLQPERLSVDDLLREIRAGMELQFPDSGVVVDMDGEQGLVVMTDRKSLKQILRNLVANAYEAMPSGGRLLLRRDRNARGVTLTVTDSGPGIDPAVLAHLFTPYTTTKSTGTGLGLAISHKLAAELGAELSVSSEPGSGTTFRLHVPLIPALSQAAAASQEPS